MVFREVEARALEDAFHRYYPQLCAVATQVLGGDESLPRTPYRKAWLRGLLLVTVRNCVRNLRRGPAAHEQTIAEEGRANPARPCTRPGRSR